MRGIEPPPRAWEARVLPLNYIRGTVPAAGSPGHETLAGFYQSRFEPGSRTVDASDQRWATYPPIAARIGAATKPAMMLRIWPSCETGQGHGGGEM